MTQIEYVSVANIIGDDLIFPDGRRQQGLLGGAGTYAAAGMRLWSDSVGIVSGVGEDFEQIYGTWFRHNQIDTAGLHVCAPNTPRSWVNYQSADARIETPQFGDDHFRMMEPTIHDLPESYREAAGLYLFRDVEPTYWAAVFALRDQNRPTIVWELHAGAANPTHWPQVAEILAQVDLFSINLAEARQLCGVSEPAQILDKLLATGVKGVALRAGSTGSIVADMSGAWQIPVCPVPVVDVTGAGNAFTGGFLVGYCKSCGDIVAAGLHGAVSASYMLEQFGPPNTINAATRRSAETRLAALQPVQVR